MSAVAYALTAHKIEAESLEGALNFVITNSLGAFLFLWGIALIYGNTGALNLAQIGEAVARLETIKPGAAVMVPFALIATGLMVKAGLKDVISGHDVSAAVSVRGEHKAGTPTPSGDPASQPLVSNRVVVVMKCPMSGPANIDLPAPFEGMAAGDVLPASAPEPAHRGRQGRHPTFSPVPHHEHDRR